MSKSYVFSKKIEYKHPKATQVADKTGIISATAKKAQNKPATK